MKSQAFTGVQGQAVSLTGMMLFRGQEEPHCSHIDAGRGGHRPGRAKRAGGRAPQRARDLSLESPGTLSYPVLILPLELHWSSSKPALEMFLWNRCTPWDEAHRKLFTPPGPWGVFLPAPGARIGVSGAQTCHGGKNIK